MDALARTIQGRKRGYEMKIFILECTENELRANKGIMDAIVDACTGAINAFYGTINPCQTEQEDEPQESEDNE